MSLVSLTVVSFFLPSAALLLRCKVFAFFIDAEGLLKAFSRFFEHCITANRTIIRYRNIPSHEVAFVRLILAGHTLTAVVSVLLPRFFTVAGALH